MQPILGLGVEVILLQLARYRLFLLCFDFVFFRNIFPQGINTTFAPYLVPEIDATKSGLKGNPVILLAEESGAVPAAVSPVIVLDKPPSHCFANNEMGRHQE